MGKELHKIFYLNIIQPVTRDKENLRWGEGVQISFATWNSIQWENWTQREGDDNWLYPIISSLNQTQDYKPISLPFPERAWVLKSKRVLWLLYINTTVFYITLDSIINMSNLLRENERENTCCRFITGDVLK